MKFYMLSARQDYAGYYEELAGGKINDSRIPEYYRRKLVRLIEYLGVPPVKPRKKGDFHMSACEFFAREKIITFLACAEKCELLTNRTEIIGREDENIFQFWVVNVVDCLDVEKTIASEPYNNKTKKMGVIKRPVFDESKWDGSDLFIVPQDPNYCLFCSENFVKKWKENKFKGAEFSRYLFDPDKILL